MSAPVDMNRSSTTGKVIVAFIRGSPGGGGDTRASLHPRAKPRTSKVIPAQSAGITTRSVPGAAAARTRLVLRFVDPEGAPVKVFAVQGLHGPGGIRARHLDEPKATGPARVAIVDQ